MTIVDQQRAPAVPPAPPARRTLLGEAASALELARLGGRSLALARQPRGAREPVRLFPGLRAGEGSLAPLRRYLAALGYDALGWGLGRNSGEVPALLRRAVQRVERDAAAAGAPVHLVGWSLGGVIARELARDRPDLVAQVITFGSPIVGGPRYTALAHRFPPERLAAIEAGIREREARPIGVPVTAIHSRRDGIVGWTACVDATTPGAENIEVRSTHIGMGIDPDVWVIVAQRLAAHLAR
jgi:hypothetical protein